jgi:ankyrin repeat protein
MFAAMFGRHELLQLLLEAGADKNIKDVRGLTALHLAGQQGNETAWKLLGGESRLIIIALKSYVKAIVKSNIRPCAFRAYSWSRRLASALAAYAVHVAQLEVRCRAKPH